jgi:glutamate-1-semialdehyde 2,1-aminomutase
MKNLKIGSGQRLYQNAKKIIPGGAQLLGKRSEMYLPEYWPAYYSKAKGCQIWDLDGSQFLDCTMVGIGASVLGYSDPDVNYAVIKALESGSLTTLNAPEEVYLAEELIGLHPWAEMVRYARSGGEIMSIAIRVARAASGREKIAFCGYHGWHDWYLSANLSEDKALDGHLLPGLNPDGVPRGLKGTLFPFSYNQIEELKKILSVHGSSIAAIVMEPCRDKGPQDNFLHEVRKLADIYGAALIFDEITCGWRMGTCGMHMIYGVYPDLVTFGKTMSNGVPMAALIGKRSLMEAAQSTFISSTYWTDKMGPSAALATIKKHKKLDLGKIITETGLKIQRGWKDAANTHGLDILVSGIPPLATFKLINSEWPVTATYFIQEMLKENILASDRFYANYCHTNADIKKYFAVLDKIFKKIALEQSKGNSLKNLLQGPVKHMGFTRLT